MYVREDLAYKLIYYINQGVMETNEFRKNLCLENDQSIRIEREMVAIIMKIFAKEIMARQYKIDGLPYRVDLCFVAHKLIIEIDEESHSYYKNDQIRQKLIGDHGFTFIRINLDPNPDGGFGPDAEIAKIYNYINQSSVKLAANSAEKSLQRFTKELLSYMSSISKPLCYIKYFIKKNATYLIKNG